jgi:hypothetical protein
VELKTTDCFLYPPFPAIVVTGATSPFYVMAKPIATVGRTDPFVPIVK